MPALGTSNGGALNVTSRRDVTESAPRELSISTTSNVTADFDALVSNITDIPVDASRTSPAMAVKNNNLSNFTLQRMELVTDVFEDMVGDDETETESEPKLGLLQGLMKDWDEKRKSEEGPVQGKPLQATECRGGAVDCK